MFHIHSQFGSSFSKATLRQGMSRARLPVQELLDALSNFERIATDTGESLQCPRTLRALADAKEALDSEFDLEGPAKRQRTRDERLLQKKLAPARQDKKTLELELAKSRGEKIQGRIHNLWLVRVGLSDTLISVREIV